MGSPGAFRMGLTARRSETRRRPYQWSTTRPPSKYRSSRYQPSMRLWSRR